MKPQISTLLVLFVLVAISVPACPATARGIDVNAIHQQFAAKDAKIAELKAEIVQLKQTIDDLRRHADTRHDEAIGDREQPPVHAAEQPPVHTNERPLSSHPSVDSATTVTSTQPDAPQTGARREIRIRSQRTRRPRAP